MTEEEYEKMYQALRGVDAVIEPHSRELVGDVQDIRLALEKLRGLVLDGRKRAQQSAKKSGGSSD